MREDETANEDKPPVESESMGVEDILPTSLDLVPLRQQRRKQGYIEKQIPPRSNAAKKHAIHYLAETKEGIQTLIRNNAI